MKLDRPSHSLSLAGHVALDITSLYLLSNATSNVQCVGLNMEINVVLPMVFGTKTQIMNVNISSPAPNLSWAPGSSSSAL